jgi:membrane protein DedA with SNARE-associated domain
LAVFLGAGLEGEAAVTTGGYMAHRGLIDPYVAAICAFMGSFTADQIVFLLARYHRENAFIQRVRQRPVFARAIDIIERRPMFFCTAFRFIYGMRTAGPIAIGISKVPTRLFVLLNALSASIWAAIFTFIGYRFGNAFEALVERVVSSPWTIGTTIVLVLSVAGFVIARHRKQAQP